jgi:hypothetical protein
MAVDIRKLVKFALSVADAEVPGVLRPVTYINVPGNPDYDPDTNQIINGISYGITAVVSGFSAFEIANNIAAVNDIKLTIAAADLPIGFKPTLNDRVIVDGDTALVASWQEGTIKDTVLSVRAHRP